MSGVSLFIALVAFVIPILLVLGALFFDAAFLTWLVYVVWHDRARAGWRRLLHRPT